MSKRPSQFALLAFLLLGVCPLHAEDIDLFINRVSGATNNLPNVLFIVDNTGNWTQPFPAEVAALSATFQNLTVNPDGTPKFNVGVMLFTESGKSHPGSNSGGYVRAAIRPMTKANSTLYGNMIQTLDSGFDKGSAGQSGLAMAEAYYYFSGRAPFAGNTEVKADSTGNLTAGWGPSYSTAASRTAMQAIYALPGNALSSQTATVYNPPPYAAACAQNFIIYISNGDPQDPASSAAQSLLIAAGGDATQIPVSPALSKANYSDEWARFMKQSSVGVTTYTIDVGPATNGQGAPWTAQLKSMATVSGGKYTAIASVSAADIMNALSGDLSEIQAVNSVFASVSLPVSVNTQGTYLNQVFVGMFRPDAGALPRWAGNLKQYKLGDIGTSLNLLDADDKSAINSSTGFITECARSFWTPTTADAYWSFKPQGGCIPPAGAAVDFYQNSNFPDGNVVEKGAQGYLLRSNTSRTLQTCSPIFSACTVLTGFDTSNSAITPILLGAAPGTGSGTERDALINWEIGKDIDDENHNGVTTAEVRPSVHGDVVHSRPVAVNFGTATAPEVIVFYGGNDGVLRAIDGNRTASIGSSAAGSELWAFVPPEFYGSIKRIRDNTTQISFPNITGVSPTPLPKPYGMDGVITAYQNGSEQWIYASMRRGGRALYKFIATVNSSGALTMSLKWKQGCPSNFPTSGTVDDTNCNTGFAGIGQTWSAPKVVKAQGSTSPLLVMGGGYDTCEDADPNSCTAASKGNEVYILNADGGALLNTLSTDRAVIADVVVVTDPATGLASVAYAADLGGNIYRIDMSAGTPDTWTIKKIASLGCSSTTTSCTANRKFMFAPDVVQNNGVNYLLLGSGDREKPLSNYTSNYGVTNYFFMVEDKPSDGTWLTSEQATCGSAVICLGSLMSVTTGSTTVNLGTKKGWYLGLAAHEQVVTSAITIYGTVNFSTHIPYVPTPGVCTTQLGTTLLYGVSYLGSASSFLKLPPVGLPPSPVAGLVTLDDGLTVPFCIGCTAVSPLQAEQPIPPPGTAPSQPKNRVYWYIQR